MKNASHLYTVPETLNNPVKVLTLTLDEFIPGVFLGLVFILIAGMYVGIGIAIAWVLFIKHMKKGRGNKWLISLAYWYLPKGAGKILFKHTPISESREYVA